jgi:hypothetical protein
LELGKLLKRMPRTNFAVMKYIFQHFVRSEPEILSLKQWRLFHPVHNLVVARNLWLIEFSKI